MRGVADCVASGQRISGDANLAHSAKKRSLEISPSARTECRLYGYDLAHRGSVQRVSVIQILGAWLGHDECVSDPSELKVLKVLKVLTDRQF